MNLGMILAFTQRISAMAWGSAAVWDDVQKPFHVLHQQSLHTVLETLFLESQCLLGSLLGLCNDMSTIQACMEMHFNLQNEGQHWEFWRKLKKRSSESKGILQKKILFFHYKPIWIELQQSSIFLNFQLILYFPFFLDPFPLGILFLKNSTWTVKFQGHFWLTLHGLPMCSQSFLSKTALQCRRQKILFILLMVFPQWNKNI